MQPLFAVLHVSMPGEIAPSHRHTQSALRFVVEGLVAYKAVDCERTQMKPGNLIITPSWTFHNDGQQGRADVDKPEGFSAHRYAANPLPLRVHANKNAPFGQTSPIFSYPTTARFKRCTSLKAMPIWIPGMAPSCDTSSR